jgi:two-component system, OmpR family, KDP operon response regulator KdpE
MHGAQAPRDRAVFSLMPPAVDPKLVQVLVVEDEPASRRLFAAALQAEGYAVHEAASVREAETLAGSRRIDLYLVDLGLPDLDGSALIRSLRRWTQRPIIVVSGRTHESQKVAALDAGADDYVVKPVGIAELQARVRALLRRVAQQPDTGESVLRCGALSIDLVNKAVWRAGEPVPLTATQWRLLDVLARQAGRTVAATELLHEVWGPRHAADGHYLRIYMRQLRQRLEVHPGQPRLLLTDTGVGYRLALEPRPRHGPRDPRPEP